jgi:hypothetical protein
LRGWHVAVSVTENLHFGREASDRPVENRTLPEESGRGIHPPLAVRHLIKTVPRSINVDGVDVHF